MIERARVAQQAGLDSLFVGDHHATPTPYYQNVAMLGRMIAEWDARPVGALFLLPLWHPVLVAEQVATLACLARGPFVLQCAIGGAHGGFDEFGIDARQRPSRFEQSLDLLRRLWSGETLDASGRFSLRGARVAPLPPEPIQVWIGASARPAIARAARMGDGWIAAPALPPAAARDQLELYRNLCGEAGRAPGRAVLRRDVYVSSSEEDAVSVRRGALDAGYRGFPEEAIVCGSVERVADLFTEFAEMGYDEILVRNLVGDQKRALSCLEQVGRVRELLVARGVASGEVPR